VVSEKKALSLSGVNMANYVFNYMLEHEGPLTVDRFVELNWFGEKQLADLEGEDLIEVQDFEEQLRELGAAESE
jgi:hypothetical protein